jgi:tetratricopeptide (TPR) repeat protein
MAQRDGRKTAELIELAKRYYQENDFEKARSACLLALGSKIGSRQKIDLLCLLGDSDFMRNELPSAKNAYNNAMDNLTGISQTQKVRAQILVSLSNVKRGLGEFDQAEADARRALEITPKQDLVTFRRIIEALCNLVKIYAATGMKTQASNILSICSSAVDGRKDPQSLSIVKLALQMMTVDKSEQ